MAADDSPPHIRPIFATAVIAVLILFGLKFVFDSYYVSMFEAEEFRKVGSVQPTQLLQLKAAEAKGFAGAPIPIEKAMSYVAKGRAEPIPGLTNDITPQQSADIGPLFGWASLPRVIPAAAMPKDTDDSDATADAGTPAKQDAAPADAPPKRGAIPASSAKPGAPTTPPPSPPPGHP